MTYQQIRAASPRRVAGPSQHLSWRELACADGTPYPVAWPDRAIRLAAAFEGIRALWNQPITIRSAYRTPEHNAAIYRKLGKPVVKSQHVEGLALDLAPPEGVPVQDFWEDIVRLAPRLGIGGIGYASPSKGAYVHIDLRPGPLTQWRY